MTGKLSGRVRAGAPSLMITAERRRGLPASVLTSVAPEVSDDVSVVTSAGARVPSRRWLSPLRSPPQGLALAVGALGCGGRTRLTEDAVLAGPQDGTVGPLPAGHTLLGTELEDHLQDQNSNGVRRPCPGWTSWGAAGPSGQDSASQATRPPATETGSGRCPQPGPPQGKGSCWVARMLRLKPWAEDGPRGPPQTRQWPHRTGP